MDVQTIGEELKANNDKHVVRRLRQFNGRRLYTGLRLDYNIT